MSTQHQEGLRGENPTVAPDGMDETKWQAVEKKFNEGMDAKREANIASVALFQETNIPKGIRDQYTPEELAGLIQDPDWEGSTVEIALSDEKKYEKAAQELLNPENNPEVAALMALSWKNLATALRKKRSLDREYHKMGEREEQISAIIKINGQSPSRHRALEIAWGKKETIEDHLEALRTSTPEAFYGFGLLEIKKFQKEFEEGEMVEIPYTVEKENEIKGELKRGQPVFIHGDLGGGKSELAFHVAREATGKDPLIISGSEDISLAELYGHQVLKVSGISIKETQAYNKMIDDEFNLWVNKNPEALEDEKNRAHDRILRVTLAAVQGGTISDFFIGPIYKAMEEGRVVVIDEANAIPHEILISLNHILTRRAGKKVSVQQDSGREITIAEGFGIIFTGNFNQLNEKYIGRKDMDPAFLSRMYKVDYDYPPQATEGNLEEEAGEKNELFTLVVSMVASRNGNLIVPEDALQKLWRLCQAARITQNVFSGKKVEETYWYKEEGGSRPVKPHLQEAVLSIRTLKSIIDKWRDENYKKELDYYIWENFASQSTVSSDRAYLYQLLKHQFGFFQSKGWPSPSYDTDASMTSFEIEPPKNKSAKLDFIGPRRVVEAVYGKPPKRAEWPALTIETDEDKDTISEADKLRMIETAEKTRVQWGKDLTEILEKMFAQGDEIPAASIELAKTFGINTEKFESKK